MKIVQIITELRPAGAERVVVNLSKNLQERGHEITVISLEPLPAHSKIIDELEDANIPVKTLGVTKYTCWRMFKLRNLLRKIQPNIVHTHLVHSNIISRVLSIPKRYPLINTVHIAEKRPGKGWHFWLDRITYKLCDCETCVSYAVRDYHSRRTGIQKNDMPVIYNGIHGPSLLSRDDCLRLRKEWGMENCSYIIGSVGRLDYQKGYDMLLKIAEKSLCTTEQSGKYGIVIVGDGPMKKELEDLAEKVNPTINVCLPGFLSNAARCIGAFDVFVMPSRYEGFGLTLIEAMAHGVPILANNVDSLPELMKHYPNGCTAEFSLLNPKEFFDKIRSLAKSGFKDPVKPFSVDRMATKYENLYSTL